MPRMARSTCSCPRASCADARRRRPSVRSAACSRSMPRSLSGDSDPVDVLVVMPLPLVPGCVIRCRPVGLLAMCDEAGEDTKVVAVPLDEVFAGYREVREARDLPQLTRERIVHFFEHYKDLEPGKWVKLEGWKDAAAARREIVDGVERFRVLPAKERPPF